MAGPVWQIHQIVISVYVRLEQPVTAAKTVSEIHFHISG